MPRRREGSGQSFVIATTFGWHLGSTAAETHAEFQSDTIIIQ